MKTLILLLFFVSAAPASEDNISNEIFLPLSCFPFEVFLSSISEKYEENLVFISESKNNIKEPLFHQLWVNNDTQTWTFFVVNPPRKTACLIASGKGFNNWGPSI